MKPARQSNIELLRTLTMCGVVLLHYNGGVGNALELVQDNTLNYWILMVVESLCICAVNVFLLISGYFSCTSQRRDPVKALELLVQVVVFQLALYLPGALMDKTFSFGTLVRNLLPVNYFAVMYVALYFVGPYINILLRNLTKIQFSRLLLLLLCLFSVLPTAVDILQAIAGRPFAGLNPVGMDGDGNGYTIVNFVLMYVLGAYLRQHGLPRLKAWHTWAVAVLGAGSVLALSLWQPSIARAYCNPGVIALAVAIFLLFNRLQFQSKVVNHLSKAAYTVFLFHTYPLSKLPIAQAVAGSPVYLVCHMLLAAIAIYLVSWVIYLVYDLVTKPVFRLLRKVLPAYEV